MTTQPLPTDAQGRPLEAPFLDWDNGDALAFTDTAASSPALTTDLVLLCATEDCLIKFGDDPTASAGDDSMYLPKKQMIWLSFVSGQKISAIRDATSGTLYIVPAVSVSIS